VVQSLSAPAVLPKPTYTSLYDDDDDEDLIITNK
jgi:hypothetical protein